MAPLRCWPSIGSTDRECYVHICMSPASNPPGLSAAVTAHAPRSSVIRFKPDGIDRAYARQCCQQAYTDMSAPDCPLALQATPRFVS